MPLRPRVCARVQEKIKNANIFRIIRLMLLMCLIAHWTACLWHLLITRFDDLEFSIPRSGPVDEYLSCFYGSFLLMVGDNVEPANNVERIFCWCALRGRRRRTPALRGRFEAIECAR